MWFFFRYLVCSWSSTGHALKLYNTETNICLFIVILELSSLRIWNLISRWYNYDFSQFLYVDSGVIFIDCPQWFAIEGYSILVFSPTTENRDKLLSFPVDCKTIYTHIYEQPLSNSSPFLRKSDCVHLATDNVELRSKVVCTWMYIMYTFLELFKPAFKRNVCRVRFIIWQEIWREV